MIAIRTITIVFCVGFGLAASSVYAEETTTEKAQNMGNKTADSVRSTARDVDDKVCEMIDGELKCLPKKIKNKAKTAADKTETKAEEIKNKVD